MYVWLSLACEERIYLSYVILMMQVVVWSVDVGNSHTRPRTLHRYPTKRHPGQTDEWI